MWSCGVILYALLAGCLPFDDENTRRLLQKVKSGVFTMHNAIPQGPADLIKRMLVINPADRITLDEIKRHPWFQKRKFLLDNGAGPLSNPPSPAALQPYTQHTLANVDEEILQNLSLLGYGSQDDIIRALCTPEPNYEKVFYWLLDQKKTEQLENFDPHIDAALGQQQQCEDDGGKTPRKRVSSRSSIGSARALSVYCTPNGSQMDLNLASPLSPKSPRDTFIVSPGASNGSSTEINVKRMTTEGSRVRPVNPSPLAVHLPTVNSNNSSATGTNNNNVNAVAEKLQRLQMNNINTGQQQQPNYEVTQSLPSLNSTNANSANSVSNSSAEEAPKSPKKRFDLFSKLRASVGSVKTNTASASDVSKDDSGLNSPVMSNSNIPKTSWFDTLLKFKPGTFQFSRKESTSVSRSLVVQTLAVIRF